MIEETLRRVGVVIAIGLAASPTAGLADDDDGTPPADGTVGGDGPADPLRGRQLYELGKKLFAAGEFAEAARTFQESYRIDPRPGALFNQGRCLEEDGQKAAAAAAYRAFIKVQAAGGAAEEARTRVLALERQLELEGSGSGSGNDGTDMGTPPRPGRTLRLAGYSAAIGGAGFLIVGGLFALEARSISNELDDRPAGPWTDAEIARFEEGEAADRRAVIFASIGAAAAVTGAVLVYLGHRAGREVQLAPALAPTSAGATVSIRF